MSKNFEEDFNLFIQNYYKLEQQKEIVDYLNQLNDEQRKVCLIAFNHLKSSFNIFKSNGFQKWKQKC